MISVVREIPYSMITETDLPNGAAIFHAERESSLNELHSTLQRNFR